MAKAATTKQREILAFLIECVEGRGVPPSISEIGERFGIGSNRGVTTHLDALERKGYIARLVRTRGMRILRDADGFGVRLRFVREGAS